MTETAGSSPQATESKTAERSMKKCDFCRTKKIKCTPVNRKWPDENNNFEKCEACEKAGQPCGPNTRARPGSIAPAANGTRSTTAEPNPNEGFMPTTQLMGTLVRESTEYAPRQSLNMLMQGEIRGRQLLRSAQDVTMHDASPRPHSAIVGQPQVRHGGDNSPFLGPVRPSSPLKRSHHDAFKVPTPSVYRSTDVSKGGFRLLRLHAGSKGPLKGTLYTAEFPRENGQIKTPYEAVSWTWGSEASNSGIEIHSSDQIFTIPIKSNLEVALMHLRDVQSYRMIWVDQICINRDNMQEMNTQVTSMGKIFRGAEKVHVFLGREESDTSATFAFIHRLQAIEDLESLVCDRNSVKDWQSLFHLLQNPWFGRRWTLQEISLAKEAVFCYGSHSIRWDQLACAISLVASRADDLRKLFRSSGIYDVYLDCFGDFNALPAVRFVEVAMSLFRRDDLCLTPLLSLEQLVSSLQYFESSHAHDFVYALLGLASDVSAQPWSNPSKRRQSQPDASEDADDDYIYLNNLDIQPWSVRQTELAKNAGLTWLERFQEKTITIDYAKPILEVYKEFLKFTIKKSGSLDILCRPWAPKARESLPSWISTFSGLPFRRDGTGIYRRVRADPLVGMPDPDIRKRKNYNASFRVSAKWQFGTGTEEYILSVDGFVLDSIDIKKLPAQSGNIPFEWLSMGEWTDTKQVPPDKFWKTLVADRGPDGQNAPPYYARACQYAYRLGVEGDDMTTTKLDACPASVSGFLQRVRAVCWQRCLIVTAETKLLGLVPYEAERGDLICILYGCSVPVILRREPEAANGKIYHRFIGECYIQSMMNGSALRTRDDNFARAQEANPQLKSRTETFHLK